MATPTPKAVLRLEPLGQELCAARGTPLRDVLYTYGVEFPCGGRGRCGRCRVRIDGADVLACRASVERDAVIEIGGGWQTSILCYDTIPAGEWGASGIGVAVDLGTTTIVAQLVDGQTGAVHATAAELNQQARFGADVMTRIEHALKPDGARELQATVRDQVARMVDEVRGGSTLDRGVVIVGNTAMLHLFTGRDVRGLASAPFEPDDLSEWRDGDIRFLRGIGGFVGSDILAGVIATGLAASPGINVLIDLGTNGEIVVGGRDGLLCASTAAGPAFEGGRISRGMRAGSGAIIAVEPEGDYLHCEVLGGGVAQGICGSGLVDAIAASRKVGVIGPNGRVLTPSRAVSLCDGIQVTQADVRELQLAKGAVAAGLHVLLDRLGANVTDIHQLYLAGAFGNYVRVSSAAHIGLLPFADEDRIVPVGNAALAGARMALFGIGHESEIRMEHIRLHADPKFEECYVRAMTLEETLSPQS